MVQSQQDFLNRLLKSITSFYTATYSTDTDIYAILQTYAGELMSGSQQVDTVYNNLFTLTANVQKLYDNFGTYFGQSRYFGQTVDEDLYSSISGSFSGSIPSYRKTIDFLIDAAVHGSTIYALDRVCHAFTLINPDIRELYKVPRWKLKVTSGSIGSVAGNVITVSPDPGWKHNEWQTSLASLNDGSLPIFVYTINSNTQDTFTLDQGLSGSLGSFTNFSASFTKLGSNTKLFDRVEKYFTADIVVWVAPGQDERKPAINNLLNLLRPAHTSLRVFYEPYYVVHTTTDQFNSGSGDNTIFGIQNGKITNIKATVNDMSLSGSMYISGVLDLTTAYTPKPYTTIDWAYDWVTRELNGCEVVFEARSALSLVSLNTATWNVIENQQVIPALAVERYNQWRFTLKASGSRDFELHQFTMKAYNNYSASLGSSVILMPIVTPITPIPFNTPSF